MKCPNCKKSLRFVQGECAFCGTGIEAPARPRSVTVICWILIVWCGIVVVAFLAPRSPEAEAALAESRAVNPLAYAMVYVNVALLFVCSGAMLKGFNWARWVFAIYFGLTVLRLLMADPSGGAAKVLVFLALCHLLFRREAAAFFSGECLARPIKGEAHCES